MRCSLGEEDIAEVWAWLGWTSEQEDQIEEEELISDTGSMENEADSLPDSESEADSLSDSENEADTDSEISLAGAFGSRDAVDRAAAVGREFFGLG